MVTFASGELFDSFADLQQKLTDYSEEHYCHFYIKDSKKLAQDEVVNPHLIYKHIVYCCIYGGQKPRFRGSGSRSVTYVLLDIPAWFLQLNQVCRYIGENYLKSNTRVS